MNNIRPRHQATRQGRLGGTITGSLIEVLLIAAVASVIVVLITRLIGPPDLTLRGDNSRIRDPIFRMLMTSNGRELWVQRGISGIHSVDLATGESKAIYQSSGRWILRSHVSEDGETYLLSLDDREIVIFRHGEVLIVERLFDDESVRGAALSANGQSAVLVCDLNQIRCCDLSTHDLAWSEIHVSEAIDRVALDFSGQTMAVATKSGALHLYDVKTGRRRQTLISGGSLIRNIVFSRDGNMLILPYDDSIVAYDIPTGKVAWKHRSAVYDDFSKLIMSSDGRRIAVSNLASGVLILDAMSGEKLNELQPPFFVFHLAFARDSTVLYASDKYQIWTLSFSVDRDYRVLEII